MKNCALNVATDFNRLNKKALGLNKMISVIHQ
jgi:hypothetical protein